MPVLRWEFGVVLTESPNSFLKMEYPAKRLPKWSTEESRPTSRGSWDWEAAEDAPVQLWLHHAGMGPVRKSILVMPTGASVVCVPFLPLASKQCSDGPIALWVDRNPPLGGPGATGGKCVPAV